MKKELSSLELKYILKELDFLVNSRVDSIYNKGEKEFFIQFFVPTKGKFILRIMPGFFYLSPEKDTDEKTSGMCMGLRKYLAGSRLRAITQVGSERLVEMIFEKDKRYMLFAEIFGNGNLILCDDKKIIINIAEKHTWKDRDLQIGLEYKEPPKKIDIFNPDKKDLIKILSSDKPLVKKLASDLGLGGVYSEEICLLSDIEKNKENLGSSEVEKIYEILIKITRKIKLANIVYKDNDILDIVPFKLERYKNYENKTFGSYNTAISFVLSQKIGNGSDEGKTKIYEKKIEKMKQMIADQESKMNEIKEKIDENQKIAELIYTNYSTIREAIEEINKASKKYSWQEISEKLKGHKTIKEINAKDKKIIIEI